MPTDADLSGFPYCEVRFDKDAAVVDAAEVERALTQIASRGVTDLIVVSHGWNNDIDDARGHYQQFAERLAAAKDALSAPRQLGLLAVLWPSKRFAESHLIPGGAAALGNAQAAALVQELDELAGTFDRPQLEQAKGLVPRLDDPEAQDRFVELLRTLIGPSTEDESEEGSLALLGGPGRHLFERVEAPITGRAPQTAEDEDAGGAAVTSDLSGGDVEAVNDGAAAGGLADLAQGALAAGRRLLNFTTYYEMKERSGLIGRAGLYPVLRQVREVNPQLRLHLVGHSFGARLVTAAVSADIDARLGVASLTLLQGAFSHNGFAVSYDDAGGNGHFRNVLSSSLVRGPVLVSHTANDLAVGINYAIVSRLADQQAAVGGPGDLYGGIGRNGAMHTPEATFGILGPRDSVYEFEPGKVYNLRADTVISGHSDIHKPEVANAIIQAVSTVT